MTETSEVTIPFKETKYFLLRLAQTCPSGMEWDTPSTSCRPPPVNCGPVNGPEGPGESTSEEPNGTPDLAPSVIPTVPCKIIILIFSFDQN